MSEAGLITSDQFLIDAAVTYFSEIYENPVMHRHEEIDPDFRWEPSLHFEANDHLKIIAEASETPYPEIFRLRHPDIVNVHMPIAVYCVCPEEAYLQESRQRDVNNLKAHGFGLLTVNKQGKITRRFLCIPLIQHLPESEFAFEIKGLPKKLRVRLKEVFDSYNHNAGGGVKDLTEIVEALVIEAGKKVAYKGWIDKKETKGSSAQILDAMFGASSCQNAKAAIGGARSYIKEYRHTSHHFPKNKKQAYKKYRDCLHAFRDGIKRLHEFRSAMKDLGINITV